MLKYIKAQGAVRLAILFIIWTTMMIGTYVRSTTWTPVLIVGGLGVIYVIVFTIDFIKWKKRHLDS